MAMHYSFIYWGSKGFIMSAKNLIIILISVLGCLFSLPSYSQNSPEKQLWEQWVADRHSDLDCPRVMSANKKKICSWPGMFVGTIVNEGLSFEMSVQSFAKDAWIDLPGNKNNWPINLTINQQTAIVIDSNGKPKVHIKKGENIIRGKFLWKEVPPSLTLSDSIGLVKIFRDGKILPTTINNNQLILSLNEKSIQRNSKNDLKIQVYRAIQDGVPMRLTTIIKLIVSGKSREVSIGKVDIADTRTVYLRSPLPARLEENGLLRVQVKPGIYQITVGSRFTQNATSISTKKESSQWPQNEYFSFIAAPRIREVEISGVKSIDTSLVDIPAQWKLYPTYRLVNGDKLQLKTTILGDTATHQNSVNIDREIWLSFDGKDAISKDTMSGLMHQGWRLNAAKGVKLGRASVNEKPVLITNYSGNEGVEIRSPQVNLQAVSSIPSINNINAIGWQTDVAKLTAKIHLPPGWRAVYASGVDGISGTWIQKWNLWDIFWLMILIAMVHKLIGFKYAILMAVTLMFTFHEKQAPNFLWAVLLAFIAIIGLPIGKYKMLFSRLSILPAVLLIVTFIAITISSVRLAIYPTLEKQGFNNSYSRDSFASVAQSMPEKVLMRQERGVEQEVQTKGASHSNSYRSLKKEVKQDLYQVGDDDHVQTGPGIPTWSWNVLNIRSIGMVTADQQLSLFLSSPFLTAIWRIINVLLIGLMGAVMLRSLFNIARGNCDLKIEEMPTDKKMNSTVCSIIIALSAIPLVFCLLLSPQNVNAAAMSLPDKAGYPPEYLLKEFESRLLQEPPCLPTCVSLNKGLLEVRDQQLTLSFSALADADMAMALPAADDDWLLDKIVIDNKPAVVRTIRGALSIYLPEGAHSIVMQGKINTSQVSINLPLNIHNFTVDAPLWLVDGIHKGVVLTNNIGLTSKEVIAQQANNTLAPLPVKPFAIVHRSITLGKQWKIITRVEKIAPRVDSGSFTIKLLAGEQVLSSYPINDNGYVNVQVSKNRRSISWESSLTVNDVIKLTADSNPSYAETWEILPSSIWNVKFSGIKPIKSDVNSGHLQPTWNPWAGEMLNLTISRPAGVSGEVFTTENAKLIQYSGKNVQKSKLQLKVTASQGTAYEILLPDGVKINSLLHDNNKMSVNSGNKVLVQLHPGEQRIELEFEQREKFTWRNSSANIKLPGKTVNINIEYHLLNDRWLLYLTGPSLGAAILYWGVLFVILIGALVLPFVAQKSKLRMPITMLGWVLLGLGFSTVNSYGVIVVAVFFFVMAARQQYIKPAEMIRWKFNLLQLTLIALTFICVVSLLVAIPVGLLSSPEMQVVGNGSFGHFFKFFQDKISDAPLPIVTVYSLPIWFYRVVMLTWSLWLATQLIAWGKWWFVAYSHGGAWIAKPSKVDTKNKEIESDMK